jgi:hypothetical protein
MRRRYMGGYLQSSDQAIKVPWSTAEELQYSSVKFVTSYIIKPEAPTAPKLAACGGLLSLAEKFSFSRHTPSFTIPFKRSKKWPIFVPCAQHQNRPFSLAMSFWRVLALLKITPAYCIIL